MGVARAPNTDAARRRGSTATASKPGCGTVLTISGRRAPLAFDEPGLPPCAGAYTTSISFGPVIVFSLSNSSAANATQNAISPAVDIALAGIALAAAFVLSTGRHEDWMMTLAGQTQLATKPDARGVRASPDHRITWVIAGSRPSQRDCRLPSWRRECYGTQPLNPSLTSSPTTSPRGQL